MSLASDTQPADLPAETAPPSVLAADATVRWVRRVSPSLVRVALTSPAFADLGEEGFDTRFKLVLPGDSGVLPDVPERGEDYYAAFLAVPELVRPTMRTYTVRDVVREADEVLLVVDLVVHDEHLSALGQAGLGPACRWALAARPGDALQVIAPHRRGEYAGAEFDPAGRPHLLLIGDATALPAIARILIDLAPGHTGSVFVEVPCPQDVLDLEVPVGFEVHWIVRGDGDCGRRTVEAVRRHLGLPPTVVPVPLDVSAATPAAGDVDVWETPRYSASGEDLSDLDQPRSLGHDLEDTYAWIAGESWMVRSLRRALVTELGLDRSQVAFMGYWREGVAMKG